MGECEGVADGGRGVDTLRLVAVPLVGGVVLFFNAEARRIGEDIEVDAGGLL